MKRGVLAGVICLCSSYARAAATEARMPVSPIELTLDSTANTDTDISLQATLKNNLQDAVRFQWSNYEEPSLIILDKSGKPLRLKSSPIPAAFDHPKEQVIVLTARSGRIMRRWSFIKRGNQQYGFDSHSLFFSDIAPGSYTIQAEMKIRSMIKPKKTRARIIEGQFLSKPLTVNLP